MPPAAILIAKGKTEGVARGRLLGGITPLELVLNLPATPSEILESLKLPELEAVFQKLQAQHHARVPEAR